VAAGKTARDFFNGLLGRTPAVRAGAPGLVARGCAVSVSAFRYAVRGREAARRSRPSVALLDDALPGHDRAANARLVAALERCGLAVTRLTADQAIDPAALTAEAYDVLAVPQCDAAPVALVEAVRRFAREGGHLIFIGGPFLDRGLAKVGSVWLDREGQARLLRETAVAHRPFEIRDAEAFKRWKRSSSNRESASSLRVVAEGEGGSPCLRLDVPDLQGWDVFHSPELPALFGKGHDLFTFRAKGDGRTRQLAVEVVERDGSRWIATAPLPIEWGRVALRLADFRYWNDSRVKGRGGAGDRLRPENAATLSVGFSASHTPGVGGGAHVAWLADVGTSRDPLAGTEGNAADAKGSIECVYPRYKVFELSGQVNISRGTAVPCTNVICAIPRTLGEGWGRGAKWRFVALAEARARATGGAGACEWLVLHTRWPLAGTATAGFGYTDPAVWSSEDVVGRIAETAERLTRGVLLEEAGTDCAAYWTDEPVRVGARARFFGSGAGEETALRYEVTRNGVRVAGGEIVWNWGGPGAVERELG